MTGVLVVGQTYVVLGMTRSMAETFGTPPGAVTTATTAFGIAYAAGFLVTGPIAARFGARRVLLVGLVAASVATAVTAVPSTLGPELAARAVQGALAAVFAPCALVLIAQRFTGAFRTLSTAALTTAFLASAIVMPLLAAPVAESQSWRWVFIVSAVALAACTVALAVVIPRAPVAEVPARRAATALLRVIRRPLMLALYFATAVLLTGYVALFTLLQLAPPGALLELPGELQGLRLATLPAFVLVVVVAASAHRIPARWRAVGGFVVAALGAGLAAAATKSALVGGVVVFAAAIAFTAPAIVERLLQVGASDEPAAITAWYGAFTFLGGSVGPLIATKVAGASVTHPVLIIAGAVLVGAVLSAVVPERQRRAGKISILT
ncbi:MFS transporter [Streptomyces brasiliensis]|uniref:MFS transporter n=1 Tax=Streptomyces brasiliensis TaxID=1954 RepID=UPI001E33E223|nr:MFS transporter [Streptomyces brasiliensis]